jgi:(4-(4-[2-(gamma-L-glutamylamino)ethyl]phenoxymethyl)furan-2-yl)methanamine synthase
MRNVMGWDIGGAHVKAVLLDNDGNIMRVVQLACPLWLGINQLTTAMVKILKNVAVEPQPLHHAVTMTGELVDLFVNRHEGVVAIAECVSALLGNNTLFYCNGGETNTPQFVTKAHVSAMSKWIASANWHASACLVAQHLPSALLVDIGSTTTDIIAIHQGKIVSRALTDAERMQQDALVYTGVVRTPVMAVAHKLCLDNHETNVAAELFATMADVYRLTGELCESVDMADTADGEPKTILASARRLARMVGHDMEDKPLQSWQNLAQACREKQCNQIQLAIQKQLIDNMTIVGAGAGHFLVETIAQSLQQHYTALSSILGQAQHDVVICLPAYAVANLAYQMDTV